jgi:hypothetical protein
MNMQTGFGDAGNVMMAEQYIETMTNHTPPRSSSEARSSQPNIPKRVEEIHFFQRIWNMR